MRTILFTLTACLALCGCRTNETTYVEGTSLVVGLRLPMVDGGGLATEFVSYLNGARFRAGSNRVVRLSRTHTASNEYFGVVHTHEGTKTVLDVE